MTLVERKSPLSKMPPDQEQREQALAPDRSVLVQAPAGSGKTSLLTKRFLRLLGEVNDPAEIVAITFTKAAAAEMRHRILAELEKAAEGKANEADVQMSEFAARALERSQQLEWNLLELSSQLRISTIDSFCRELALQQPLLSGLGGGLDIAEQPEELYRRAARNTLEALEVGSAELQTAIETLLMWRDNNWKDVEDQLVEMLAKRDRWMQDFVLLRRQSSEQDWEELREKLERPFANAVAEALRGVSRLPGAAPGLGEEALALARFACEQKNYELYTNVAELAELPREPFADAEALDAARQAYLDLAELLLTKDGDFRKTVNVSNGFPATAKGEKQRHAALVSALREVEGFAGALADVRELPPARYTEEDWQIVRACFTLLRHAAAELRVAFAEAGLVDYTEVAQMAQRVLQDADGLPTEAALAVADGIHHLLVDEFQDTSRKQHRLIASLVAAWPDSTGRTVFVVGDPMQSIYFFRDADAELFPRVQKTGLELPNGDAHLFDFAPLASNFRTAPELVEKLNDVFAQVFGVRDGSGVTFSEARPARTAADGAARLHLHLEFVPQTVRKGADAEEKKAIAAQREAARDAQVRKIVELVESHAERMDEARRKGEKYRIAVLGRTKNALGPIAAALRTAGIRFVAVDLEGLSERPEVLDVLALAKALMNGEDRVAWLGVLRAPWCGLSLADLHALTSADDAEIRRRAVPQLLRERVHLLSDEGQRAVARVAAVFDEAPAIRTALPVSTLGTWLQQIWLRLGGAECVDATARENLELLWSCLDALPDGEPDLLGHALDEAIAKLTAQPDPAAENDCGVHLMTIHKSKGLEFEVVIVPELQARGMVTTNRMMAWLERGVADVDETGEITEFLVAPQQSKGEERELAKGWVDGVYRSRELQEMRRILYVAATRAREELHLFARPEYRETDEGRELAAPSGSLLATAWPALSEEVSARFAEWEPGEVDEVEVAAAEKVTMLRRLPASYEAPVLALDSRQADVVGLGDRRMYTRHEGGLLSRALGTAVHTLLEEMARLRVALEWDEVKDSLAALVPRVVAQVRAAGMEKVEAERLGAEALAIALRAADDVVARWILSPHVDAVSETRWAGVLDGKLRTVQADRVFRADLEPMTDGDGAWWIVDYKTAHADMPLEELRKVFAPQLELYARVLRLLHGDGIVIRAGLYYPRMGKLDWWDEGGF